MIIFLLCDFFPTLVRRTAAAGDRSPTCAVRLVVGDVAGRCLQSRRGVWWKIGDSFAVPDGVRSEGTYGASLLCQSRAVASSLLGLCWDCWPHSYLPAGSGRGSAHRDFGLFEDCLTTKRSCCGKRSLTHLRTRVPAGQGRRKWARRGRYSRRKSQEKIRLGPGVFVPERGLRRTWDVARDAVVGSEVCGLNRSRLLGLGPVSWLRRRLSVELHLCRFTPYNVLGWKGAPDPVPRPYSGFRICSP